MFNTDLARALGRLDWRRWNMPDEKANDAAAPEKGRESQPKPGEAADMTDALVSKDKMIEDLTATLKRVQAEYENYKKRMEREWSEKVRMSSEKVIADLLPLLDTLDKALETAKKDDAPKNLYTGLEGIHRQFLQVLQRHGLKEVKTSGKLDPFEHEALMREELEDCEDGKILEVFQKGYYLGPKVIRTAKVKVARLKEPGTPKPEHQDNQESKEHKADSQQE